MPSRSRWNSGERLRIVVLIVCAALVVSTPAVRAGDAEWIADGVTGCRVSNPNPQPNESIRWSGACVDGVGHGPGVIQWYTDDRPNERYEGVLRDGKMDGRGFYSYASGNRYEGEWLDDKRHGHGVFVFTNGARFDGEWRDNKPNGAGTYTARDGATYTGTWTDGCFRQGDRQIAVGASREACGFR